jgi:hypothetical protein
MPLYFILFYFYGVNEQTRQQSQQRPLHWMPGAGRTAAAQ